MSVSVSFNGTTYTIPTVGETGWGPDVTAIIQDFGGNATTLTGTQTLTNKTFRAADGTSSAPSFSFSSDTNTGLYRVGADIFAAVTNATEVLRLDASQRLLVGATSSVSGVGSTASTVQISNGTGSGLSIARFTANSSGNVVQMLKSRHATYGSHTVVQSGDTIGTFQFGASDGTNFIVGAEISGIVGGTPGTNDMPGAITFAVTADGASSVTERMRIAADGTVSIGAAPGADGLRVTATSSSVNYITMTGSTTGNALTITAAGTDSNIGVTLTPKGTGQFVVSATSAMKIPVGTSAQEPAAANGMIRYDSDTGKLRAVEGGTWTNVIATSTDYWTEEELAGLGYV